MTTPPRSHRFAVVLAGLTMVLAGCSGSRPSPSADVTETSIATTTTTPPGCVAEKECRLRDPADRQGLYIGAAVDPDRLDTDPRYAATVAREFNSITAENAMKWTALQPRRESWNFGPADRLVAFAEAHDIAVHGHTLVWGQDIGNGLPAWVRDLDDPAELEAAIDAHITTVVGRYRGRVDRWDVVNEPLQISGGELDQNHLLDVLGPAYIGQAFRVAHRADPAARLYLNENLVERLPVKAAALLALIDQLLAEDVPIHGVGLQAHQFDGVGPPAGELARLVTALRDRGLDVAITELDIPLTQETGLQDQAETYHRLVTECLEGGCREITVWGVDDAHTWLDQFLGREHTDPLLFDKDLRPKPAYDAVLDALDDR